MEGFNEPVEKKRPTDGSEKILNREEKIKQAEISIRDMINDMMAPNAVIERIIKEKNLSFKGPEDRDFIA